MSCSLCSDGKPPTSSLSWYWLVLCQSFSRIVCMAFHLRWLASYDPWNPWPGYGLGSHAAEAECCGRAQRPSDWQRASVSTSKTCDPSCNWPQSNSAFWTKVTSQHTTSLDQQTLKGLIGIFTCPWFKAEMHSLEKSVIPYHSHSFPSLLLQRSLKQSHIFKNDPQEIAQKPLTQMRGSKISLSHCGAKPTLGRACVRSIFSLLQSSYIQWL